MRRITRASAVITAAVTALALAGTAGAATTTPDPVPVTNTGDTTAAASTDTAARSTTERRRPTRFAMKTMGYGTRVTGGQVPVESGTTALSVISCTNETGIRRSNEVAQVDLPEGFGSVRVVNTELRTVQRRRAVHVQSVSEVAGITLMESSIGRLSIGAFKSTAHVWHNPDGFHAKVVNKPAAIEFQAADGSVTEFPFPTDRIPVIEIPGLARIELGHKVENAKRNAAQAYGNALRITLIPTNTMVKVGHTNAYIGDGITHGLFKGGAHGLSASALDGLVNVGRTPNTPMPCRGTGGKLKEKSVADVGTPGSPLDGVVEVSALTTSAKGVQTRRKTAGWTQAQVASVKLGGQVEIKGVVARANVKRARSGKIRRNARGTTLGAFVVNGEETAFPDPGQPIEIPGGLLKLETNVIDKSRRGIKVTAIRLTVLEGTAAGTVVNIGHARLRVKPSGL